MSLGSYIIAGLGATSVLPQLDPTPTASAAFPNPTICGDIVSQKDTFVFDAVDVYTCLSGIPFNADVATRFLHYYNDTLQFQSSLAYLKNPPDGYQQPATDLVDGINRIQHAIDNGVFKNQYDFEASLQSLIYTSHDNHLQLVAGAIAPFTYSIPLGYEIVSVSLDGIELPKVYIAADVYTNVTENISWKPSAISQINGMDAIEYLTLFAAANSVGGLEPHTDWNMMMRSPALDIQGLYEVFAGTATFYPGESIQFSFENGSSTEPMKWWALYQSPGYTGPLETGGDFYNYFVLGLLPASYDEEADSQDDSSTDTSGDTTDDSSDDSSDDSGDTATTGWGNAAYPEKPDISQTDLSTTGEGFITGYFLNDTKIAVLSIPSFVAYSESVATFSQTITDFIKKSKAAGMEKIIIDLQQNNGGNSLLAIDAFKQFFPQIEPFHGSRRRGHNFANLMGEAITDFWDALPLDDDWYYDYAVNEWVVTDRLDAVTDKNFTSWEDYYGPASRYHEDQFTKVERYNLSSYIFTVLGTGYIGLYGYNNRPATSPQPFDAEDIIILSDGLCSSACALFMEMMHYEGGVRTIAVGGRPSYGPMQAPAGSRGARVYDTDTMDNDISWAQEQTDAAADGLPDRWSNQDVWISYASINLRDSIRDRGTIPLQFRYVAATCRIFFTPYTFYNYTALWNHAGAAMWADGDLCVKDSTGYSTTGASNATISTLPTADPRVTVPHNMTGMSAFDLDGDGDADAPDFASSDGVINASSGKGTSKPQTKGRSGALCTARTDCDLRFECESAFVCDVSSKGEEPAPGKVCKKPCRSNDQTCPELSDCKWKKTKDSERKDTRTGKIFYTGWCEPYVPKICPSNLKTSSTGAGAPSRLFKKEE